VFFLVRVLALVLGSEAIASEICMPADEMEAALLDWYDEHPDQENPSEIALWKSDGGETWTIVRYNDDGTACTLHHGTDWNASKVSFLLTADSNQ
jgi:hypothetical protein